MMKKPQNQLVVGILMGMIGEILGLPAVRPPNQGQARDVIYFSDLLTSKYANYVIQASFEVSDIACKQIMLAKM